MFLWRRRPSSSAPRGRRGRCRSGYRARRRRACADYELAWPSASSSWCSPSSPPIPVSKRTTPSARETGPGVDVEHPRPRAGQPEPPTPGSTRSLRATSLPRSDAIGAMLARSGASAPLATCSQIWSRLHEAQPAGDSGRLASLICRRGAMEESIAAIGSKTRRPGGSAGTAWSTPTWVREGTDGLTVIDTAIGGSEGRRSSGQRRSSGCRSGQIVLTHAHGDHVSSLDALAAELPDAEVSISAREAAPAGQGHDDGIRASPEDKLRGGFPGARRRSRQGRLSLPGELVGSLKVVSSHRATRPVTSRCFDSRDGTLFCGDAFSTLGGTATCAKVNLLFPLPGLATWHKPSGRWRTAVPSAPASRGRWRRATARSSREPDGGRWTAAIAKAARSLEARGQEGT